MMQLSGGSSMSFLRGVFLVFAAFILSRVESGLPPGSFCPASAIFCCSGSIRPQTATLNLAMPVGERLDEVVVSLTGSKFVWDSLETKPLICGWYGLTKSETLAKIQCFNCQPGSTCKAAKFHLDIATTKGANMAITAQSFRRNATGTLTIPVTTSCSPVNKSKCGDCQTLTSYGRLTKTSAINPCIPPPALSISNTTQTFTPWCSTFRAPDTCKPPPGGC
jgi:hypothetical protein